MRPIRNLIIKNNAWLIQRINHVPYFPIWAHLYKSHHKHSLEDGAIKWIKDEASYANHIEMNGSKIAAIVSYGVKKSGDLRLSLHLAYPDMRLRPINTRNHLRHNYSLEKLVVGGQSLQEKVEALSFDGILHIQTSADGLFIKRSLYPSMNDSVFIEKITFESDHVLALDMPPEQVIKVPKIISYKGPYYLRKKYIIGSDKNTYYILYSADKGDASLVDFCDRQNFLDVMSKSLSIETPDEIINTAFEYCKIRVCESVFETMAGMMHSPGGGGYYAAMWTNDQCEYVHPLMPFIGYESGLDAAINCFHMFGQYDKMPSSIIASGLKAWSAAGDRGDQAMYAYGAARFALSSNREVQETLYAFIKRSIDQSLKNKNSYGVIKSHSDELENRLPSGKANLFTSSLLYDALQSFVYLLEDMEKDHLLAYYQKELKFLGRSIEAYFGRKIKNYNSYRYYASNKLLRSWICIPIAMGIKKRAKDTMNALYNELWSERGLASIEGRDIYWDRSTLYGIRAGIITDPDRTLPYLIDYSKERLLASHIPYPIEAYPEGNQKQLSGESALYMRIFTEGLFGIRPIGYKRFIIEPSLPDRWHKCALKSIRLFDMNFDIHVEKKGNSYTILIHQGDKIHEYIGNQVKVDMR